MLIKMADEVKTIVKETIDDGVRIIEYSDGSTVFKPIDMGPPKIKVDERSWWQKVKDWWNDSPVTPYVGVRDLSDPFDELKDDPSCHDGSGSKHAVEVGIRIKF